MHFILARDSVGLESNSTHLIVTKTSKDVCNGFYTISNKTYPAAEKHMIGIARNITDFNKHTNYTVRIFNGLDGDIELLNFTTKLPRSKEMSEINLLEEV
jgi:hypothetical protein